MAVGEGLARLGGYPFEVRHSAGARARARASADLVADAREYLGARCGGFRPDVALVVADEGDWTSRQPYGLPYFNDDPDEIHPGVVVMSAGPGTFWRAMGESMREASPRGYRRLRATYPDGSGGVDLQPFFDLVTVHELGHAVEVLGGLRLPTFWLGEVFANLALSAYVAARRPASLDTLRVLPSVGARSRRLAARVRAEGDSTLEELEAHYTGGDAPMSPLNYVWYQYRWLDLAARVVEREGEDVVTRFWDHFAGRDDGLDAGASTRALARGLATGVSPVLGRALERWR